MGMSLPQALPTTSVRVRAKFATETGAARVISGVAQASVIGLLAIPCLAFYEGHFDVTGYQALAGFALPPASTFFGSPDFSIPSAGPNPWIGILIAASLGGAAIALVGGPIGTLLRRPLVLIGIATSAARLATATLGIATAVAALAWYPVVAPPPFFITESATPFTGLILIFAVLGVALLSDAVGIWLWSVGGTTNVDIQPPRRYSWLAVTSVLLPFVGWIPAFTVIPNGSGRFPALVLGYVPGIVCGHVAIAQIKRSGERGRWIALTALVFGYGGALLVLLGGMLIQSAISGTTY